MSGPPKGTAPPGTSAAAVEVLRPFYLGLDWLTINMDAPMGHAFNVVETTGFVSSLDRTAQFWIVPRSQGTPAFERCVDVLDGERCKVLTIAFKPRSQTWRPEWCQVQFANATLYTGEWRNLFHMLRAHGFTLDSISRIDIAADAISTDGGGYLAVMERRMKGEVKYYGKGNWSPFMQRDGCEGFRVGEASSDKFIRCYNKTREMKKNRKPHIVNTWSLALGGEDPASLPDVHRFEARLKGKGVRRYVGARERDALWLCSLGTTQPLVGLFASMAPSLFDFRTPAARARDAQPVTAWDFSRVHTGDITIDTRAPRNHIMSDDEQKRALRYIFIAALGMSDPDAGAVALRMAQRADLGDWYAKKRLQWFRQYGKMLASGDAATLNFFRQLAAGADNSVGAVGEAFGLD